jgi:hypothetical protein
MGKGWGEGGAKGLDKVGSCIIVVVIQAELNEAGEPIFRGEFW